MKTTIEIIEIVKDGGGVIIDGKSKTSIDLQQIASAAAKSGVTVIIKNGYTKTTAELIQIAKSGKGRIIFDLTNQ
jgi:ABC-type branched-subunit amino acid transport system substrate-binding protein